MSPVIPLHVWTRAGPGFKRIGLQHRYTYRKMRLNSAQKTSRGLGALSTEQLGCVPQVVEWGLPGVLHAGVVRIYYGEPDRKP